MYDPLPPLDSINIYKRPAVSTPSRLLTDASPLSMFFQSLLPSFNVQGGIAPIDAGDGAAAAAAAFQINEAGKLELANRITEFLTGI